jgi:hypothetical protein
MWMRVRLRTVFVWMGVPAARWDLIRGMFVIVVFIVVTVAVLV